MKVLLVSEGKHELGTRGPDGLKRPGALEVLLAGLAEGIDVTFECERMSNNAVHAWHGKGPGHFKRAVGWLREAKKREVDALILVIDQDGQRDRSEQIERAQAHPYVDLPRAMGVAIRTFDAWMLADEGALTRVLGRAVDRQPEPETIRDPKGMCEALLAGSPNQMAQSEMYAGVAREIDIGVLSSRCQEGFGPFAGHVRQVFGQEI